MVISNSMSTAGVRLIAMQNVQAGSGFTEEKSSSCGAVKLGRLRLQTSVGVSNTAPSWPGAAHAYPVLSLCHHTSPR